MGLAENIVATRKVWKLRPDVLTCANTVKPMHGVVPREILGKEWWDKERKVAYQSTDYHCVACGVHKSDAKWLEGHELYRTNYSKGRQTYIETVPLCHYCHNFIHDGRLRTLYKKGEVTLDKFEAVMLHGTRVLSAAGLKKHHYIGKVAPWHKWRLVLFGVEYPPIYKDFKEWCKFFDNQQL